MNIDSLSFLENPLNAGQGINHRTNQMNIEDLQNLPDAEKAKLFAARHAMASVIRAVALVEEGMRIGLGTGSTAVWLVRLLARARADGLKFRACATSSQTTKLAESLGIKIESLDDLVPLGEIGQLDLVIDGADEFDPQNNLIKGGGGALLQEKMTARSADRFIVITDASKSVKRLGNFPLPVEVVRFAWQTTRQKIELALDIFVLAGMSGYNVGEDRVSQRMAGDAPFITDEGHYILDLHLEQSIAHPDKLDAALRDISGVVETGLFLKMANEVVMADSTGLVKSRKTGKAWIETRYELAEIADMLPKD